MATAREAAQKALLAKVAAKRAAGGAPPTASVSPQQPRPAAASQSPAKVPPPPQPPRERVSGEVFTVAAGGSGAAPAGRFAACIGIDIGACTACAAAWDGQAAKALPAFQYPADKTVPACVTYPQAGPLNNPVIGIPAYKGWASAAGQTVGGQWKRWLGAAAPPGGETTDGALQVVTAPDGRPTFSLGDSVRVSGGTPKTRYVSAEDVFAAQVARLRDVASNEHVRKPVKDCVITLPQQWSDARRAAARRAAEAKGLRVREVISDAEACAIAVGVDDVAQPPGAPLWVRKVVVVYDFGGASLDVTALRVDADTVQVLASASDNEVSGSAVDEALLDHLLIDAAKKIPDLPRDAGGRVLLDWPERLRFLSKCREAKEALGGVAARQGVELSLGREQYSGSVTKIKLESMVRPLLQRGAALVDRVLRDADLARDDVAEVVVAGGMARMAKVQQEVRKIFRDTAAFFPQVADPDQLAAQGAAIRAAALCCPGGGEGGNGVPAPAVPCVAHVCGQTFGVACAGDEVAVAVWRNMPFPPAASDPIERIIVFRTANDNQSAVDFHLVQGGARAASSNLLLGTIRLRDLPQRPRGETEVILRLCLHREGTLDAVAWVQGAGHRTGREELRQEGLYADPLPTFVASDPTTLPEPEPVGDCVHVSALLHVADVPKDAEDIRLEEARDKEWRVQREKERRERKAKLNAQRQQREEREKAERDALAASTRSSVGMDGSVRVSQGASPPLS